MFLPTSRGHARPFFRSAPKRHFVTLLAISAALAGTTAARAEGASVVHATKAQKNKASESYRDALAAIEAQKYEQALKLLDESYNTVASPNSLLLKARALSQLGRKVEAYRQLEAAEALARELSKSDEKYAQTAESAQKELVELSKSIALVTVKPSATVTVGDREIAASDWNHPQPFEPGKLKVAIRHGGGASSTQELDLGAGQTAEVSTAPPAPSAPAKTEAAPPAPPPAAAEPPGPDTVHKRTLAYVSGGIGIAGIATFAAFTYLNASGDDENAGCALSLCPESNLDTAGQNGSYQTLAFVGLGVGIVGLATGAYLYFTSSPEPPNDQPTADVTIGPGRVMVQGRF